MTRPAVAFLILAHRGPEQVGRLVRRLLAPECAVYLHVDRRTPAAVHGAMLAALPVHGNLHQLERIPTPWSSWGPVEATLRGLRAILEAPNPPEHIVLLSGQDYPLRPVEAIAGFLAEQAGNSFVASWPMPSDLYGPDGGMFRLRYWHTPVRGRRVWLPIPRRYPAGVAPHGGSAFMVLDRETAAAVLEFRQQRPDVARFHRHVWAVDEHYLQTAIHNSPRAGAVINENLWHLEWAPGSAHPQTFADSDYGRLADASRNSSDAGGEARAKLFARKFDLELDARVLDRIDADLLHA